MHTQIRPLLLATVALSMASCGGGDDDEPAEREGPQIAKASLIQRADAICTRDQARLEADLARVPEPAQRAGIELIAPFLEVNERAIRSGAKRIEALGRPSSDADVLDDYLDERETAANALGAAVQAARENDAAGLQSALEMYGRNEVGAAASRFGFKVCGVGAGRLER